MISALCYLGKLAAIAILHSAVFVLAYWAGVKGVAPLVTSEFFVFMLPAALAFCGYFYVAWRYFGPGHGALRLVVAVLTSFCALLLSSAFGVCFVINAWGS